MSLLPSLPHCHENRETASKAAAGIKTHTTIYKTDNQQRPTVEGRELYSIFYKNYKGKEAEIYLYLCIN